MSENINKTSTQKEISGFIGSYVKGQIIVAICLAALYAVGLKLVGLKFGFWIGLATGLLCFVPYLGFLFGLCASFTIIGIKFFKVLIASTFVEAVEAVSLQLFTVLGVFLIVQIIESFVLTPKIIGKKTGFSYLATLLILIIGAAVAGPVGVLVAVPIAGIARILYSRLVPTKNKEDAGVIK